MSRRKIFFVLFCSSLTVFALVLTSCSNGNLFGKLNKPGDSGDTKALLADADNALRDQNYSAALHYYERVLGSDPSNSYALYGAAAAAIRSSGIDVGTLITNVINKTSFSGVSGMGSLISKSRTSVHSSAVASNSILYGLDLPSLDNVVNTAICRFNMIAGGTSDGAIKSNDIDVIVNLGVLYFIRAVIRPVRKDFFDIVNNSGTYELQMKTALTGGVCDGSTVLPEFSSAAEQQDFILRIGKDVSAAFILFSKAVDVLHLSGNSIIIQIKEDIEDASTQVFTGASGIPPQCVDLFNNNGVSIGSSDVLSNPPTSC